ncbi:unnamed protein product [Pedinophyceae sp. YPF-701]|nr:unnamed protein product [Pedinophyceae sp. YPF-701]
MATVARCARHISLSVLRAPGSNHALSRRPLRATTTWAALRSVPPRSRALTDRRRSKTTRTHASGGEDAAGEGATDGSDGGYWTIREPHGAETEAKKSRFVAFAWPVSSGDEALARVEEASDPSASHNCFAWRIGARGLDYRSSDDGEPGGTAGRPMLSAIEGEGMSDVCVMVTRYYGGTKLGTGGLARAYGGAAREVLRDARERGKAAYARPKKRIEVEVPYAMIGAVYQVLEQAGATRLGEEFDAETASVIAEVVADAATQLEDALKNATSGQAGVHVGDS